MLTRSFLSPEALGFTPKEHSALCSLLFDMEAGPIPGFNMGSWTTCIAGQCDRRYGTHFARDYSMANRVQSDLFMTGALCDQDQAKVTLRRFLETGEVIW